MGRTCWRRGREEGGEGNEGGLPGSGFRSWVGEGGGEEGVGSENGREVAE